jgi:lipopolysaccharide export system permease protein
MSYAVIRLVPMALPLSVLMASIITFGNLGERFELLAIKASGISLLKVMKPLIFFNFIVAIFAFFMANEIVPVTNTKFFALLSSVKNLRPEMIVKEGIFSNDIDGYSIKVNKIDKSNGALLDIMIYDHTERKGNMNVTLADSGFLNISDDKHFMILNLFQGESYSEVKPGERDDKARFPFRRERFDKEEVIVNVKNFDLKRADENSYKDEYRVLNNQKLLQSIDTLNVLFKAHVRLATLGNYYNAQLNEDIQNHFKADSLKIKIISGEKVVNFNFDSLFSRLSTEKKAIILNTAIRNAQQNQRNVIQNVTTLHEQQKWINRHIIEFHRKYTFSLACFIFFLIGAPLGAIIRKGGFGLPVVISILLFISYYIVSMICENIAREGILKVGETMWFSTFVYFSIGIILIYLAVTDSLLMSSELYSKLVNKLKFLKFRNAEK